ncbi:hypothetical protein WMF37_25900 [Sorangium sp. So ce291]|uniref:hypothetical protein n=1 Tax=Sorangium sp. So ce291 TaxID=3133294 RepID=UPI003F5E3FD5
MAEWMTAEQIAARYVVGEQRLLDYGERGNLAMRRVADGRVLFDVDGVARFFRVRGAAAAGAAPGAVNGARAQHLGVLGVVTLGGVAAPVATREAPAVGGREARKRALRSSAESPPSRAGFAKAG